MSFTTRTKQEKDNINKTIKEEPLKMV